MNTDISAICPLRITSSITVYVRPGGNNSRTLTQVQTNDDAHALATLQGAMILLSKYTIDTGVTVTIQLSQNTWAQTAQINLFHPQGLQIRILGTTAVSLSTDITSSNTTTFDWSGYAANGLVIGNGNAIGMINNIYLKGNAVTAGSGIFTTANSYVQVGNMVRCENWWGGISSNTNSCVNIGSAYCYGNSVGLYADSSAHIVAYPTLDGASISAARGTLLETGAVGQIYNSIIRNMTGGNGALNGFIGTMTYSTGCTINSNVTYASNQSVGSTSYLGSSTISGTTRDVSNWLGSHTRLASTNVANAYPAVNTVGNSNSYISFVNLTNYWGSGVDGNVTYSTNTSLTSVLDGDAVVMNYNNLTINSGVTLTTSNRCRGLIIYCQGNCTINGTISMTARGAYTPNLLSEVGSNGLRIVRLKTGSTQTLSATDVTGAGTAWANAEMAQPAISGNGKIYQIPRIGGSGGTGVGPTGDNLGINGNNGGILTMCCGGGGSGSAYNSSGTSGQGKTGTCFSGGSGGGGAHLGSGFNATDYGGAGGNGNQYPNSQAGGGAGNPGGNGGHDSTPIVPIEQRVGGTGTGGLLILFVKGTLTIGSNGVISSNGSNGGPANVGPGGGSGGGIILCLYGGSFSNAGNIRTLGGFGGTKSDSRSGIGGSGGAGYSLVEQINQ